MKNRRLRRPARPQDAGAAGEEGRPLALRKRGYIFQLVKSPASIQHGFGFYLSPCAPDARQNSHFGDLAGAAAVGIAK
jgi:hypothetical protein